jgi:hypothetical protein
MQNQNWQFCSRIIAVATAIVLIASFTTLVAAQSVGAEERNAIFSAASKIPTSVKGVSVFAAPPKDFNPLTASNQELLSYGLPQRPDKATNATAYQHWERGMLALKTRVTDVEARPYSSHQMTPAGSPSVSAINGTVSYGSYNWSGIANFNHLTTWNNKTSFDYVTALWNVPVAKKPFGSPPCADGPWYEVTWPGIGGFISGSLVQGGSYNYTPCSGASIYEGWVEWYPSYSILALDCGTTLCPVGPGDDFLVTCYAAAGFADQNVFVEDITQQWSGTVTLTYVSGPAMVGSSAEYIVERPGSGGGYLPLNNYIAEFYEESYAYNGANTLFFPGNAGAATAIFTMVADDGATAISAPSSYGTAGNQGRYSFIVADETCAYTGGCAK